VNCVRFSPDGNFLASASDDRKVIFSTIQFTHSKFGELKQEAKWKAMSVGTNGGHSNDVMDLSWSADSKYLASCSHDMTIVLWAYDKKTFKKEKTIEGPTKFVKGVALHPFCNFICTLSNDYTMRVYKNRNLEKKQDFTMKFNVKYRTEKLLGDDPMEGLEK